MHVVAPQIGVTLIQAPVSDKTANEDALARLASTPGGGPVIMPDVFMSIHRNMIFGFTNRNRLPTMCPLRSFAEAGGLVSYGSNFDNLFEQAATHIDSILRGEKHDWGLAPLTGEQRRDLLEVVDDRHQRGSTIITSQVPIDAVLDRLVHNAHRLALKGDSMRKITAQRAILDATKKT
jgi:hypothetical protein